MIVIVLFRCRVIRFACIFAWQMHVSVWRWSPPVCQIRFLFVWYSVVSQLVSLWLCFCGFCSLWCVLWFVLLENLWSKLVHAFVSVSIVLTGLVFLFFFAFPLSCNSLCLQRCAIMGFLFRLRCCSRICPPVLMSLHANVLCIALPLACVIWLPWQCKWSKFVQVVVFVRKGLKMCDLSCFSVGL